MRLYFSLLPHGSVSDLFIEVPSLMLAWGVITTLTCLVQSYHGLLV